MNEQRIVLNLSEEAAANLLLAISNQVETLNETLADAVDRGAAQLQEYTKEDIRLLRNIRSEMVEQLHWSQPEQ